MTPTSTPAQALRTSACRAGVHGAIGTIAGIVLSGPLAVALVNTTHPQPPWGGPALFARSFHQIQIIPYPGGIFLVAGVVLLIASVRGLAQPPQQILADVALVFCAVFATLVFLNYIVQTTYVPLLARDYTEANASILTLFSMSNPKSLAWALEMWGWGFLGVATWLVAPIFRESQLERATGWTFVANAPVSIAGAVWTVLQPGWMMTTPGFVAFALWNVLLLAMAVLALVAFRRRARAR